TGGSPGPAGPRGAREMRRAHASARSRPRLVPGAFPPPIGRRDADLRRHLPDRPVGTPRHADHGREPAHGVSPVLRRLEYVRRRAVTDGDPAILRRRARDEVPALQLWRVRLWPGSTSRPRPIAGPGG